MKDSYHYLRLQTDESGESYLTDEPIPWNQSFVDANEMPIRESEFQKAEKLGFLVMRPGTRSDWHPAPRKQFVIVLAGKMEVEAGYGKKKQFGPGSILQATDITGKGHRTSSIGSEDLVLALVAIP